MATSRDKLNKIADDLNEIELAEVVDFAQFINKRRKKVFDEAFKLVKEEEENLTEQEISELKDASSSKSLSYKEMWGSDDL
jgi:hypothetical protein